MKKIKQKQTRKTVEAIALALRYQQAGDRQSAEALYRRILRQQPNSVQGCFGLAYILQERGCLEEAVAYYEKALKINPQFSDALYNLGNILLGSGRLDAALNYYERAIQSNPRLAMAYNNMASILQQQGSIDDAIGLYERAIAQDPDLASVHNNLGLAFQEKGQFEKAMECYKKAMSLVPDHATVHFNVGALLLMHGNYEKGWREYEWRTRMPGYCMRNFPQPRWDGSEISGRRILLYGEKGYEGFGDTIQFVRYASLLERRGAKVVIECRRELKNLVASAPGVHEVVSTGGKLPSFDLHCPYLSLPLVFKTTLESIPAEVPYLNADAALVQQWKERLARDRSRMKVGLVWSGDLRHPRSQYRSCSLEQFVPLSQTGDIALYSLQKGEAAQAAKDPPAGMKLFDYSDEITDFSDAAALAENLDLIISVDTAAAHLAGALGKPVWTLLPFVPEWRWLLARGDSPWYPTMRVFRQPALGDWDSVIARVVDELRRIAPPA